MSPSGFLFNASSARFNGLYLYKCYPVLIQQQPPPIRNLILHLLHCCWIDSIDRDGVCVVPIVPVAICGSIILNSIEQESHFCGGCHLLFRTSDYTYRLAFVLLSKWRIHTACSMSVQQLECAVLYVCWVQIQYAYDLLCLYNPVCNYCRWVRKILRLQQRSEYVAVGDKLQCTHSATHRSWALLILSPAE